MQEGEAGLISPRAGGRAKKLESVEQGLGVRDTGIANTFFACMFEVSRRCLAPVQSQQPSCKT